MKIIGISGLIGSGKSTLARYIMDAVPNSKEIAFADALKDEVAVACGVTRAYLDANKSHFRLILQGWGTDFRRQLCSKNYWLVEWRNRVTKAAINDCRLVVAPDVRFDNEVRMVKAGGGIVVRVERIECGIASDHPSEQLSILNTEFDITINNNGTLDELKARVPDVLALL